VVELLLGRVIMGAAIAGAVIADIASTWAGVRWDAEKKRPWKDAVARLGAGAGVAAGVIAVTFALGAAAVLRGGLIDIAFREGNLGLGPRASGAPAWIAAVIAVVAAVLLPRLPGFRAQRG
jgi:hypothetical protein